MNTIKVEHKPSEEKLKELRVRDWSIWEKDKSEFLWQYSDQETCYFLEGEVEVTPDGGSPIKITKGDFAVFPKGLSCTWKVKLRGKVSHVDGPPATIARQTC